MSPFKYIAKLTAGFICPPLVSPIRRMIPERVRPIASQLPVNKITNNNANVPTHSAINWRKFISSRI